MLYCQKLNNDFYKVETYICTLEKIKICDFLTILNCKEIINKTEFIIYIFFKNSIFVIFFSILRYLRSLSFFNLDSKKAEMVRSILFKNK